jgi:hypothetical protein
MAQPSSLAGDVFRRQGSEPAGDPENGPEWLVASRQVSGLPLVDGAGRVAIYDEPQMKKTNQTAKIKSEEEI